MALTPSEGLVEELSRRSFLSLWSETNPIARPGKELCDVLVVCAPDVLVFSVKEIAYRDTGRPEVDEGRWTRAAVEESAKQIYGAERWLRRSDRVIRADGSLGLSIPAPDELRLHRIAVALGSNGRVSFRQGDLDGKGFVHVLDESALRHVLKELDTIADFVDYLRAKEELVERGALPLLLGREEDLLALYIRDGRRFPEDADLLIIQDGLWDELVGRPEWLARKVADRESYVWDGLIEAIRELHESPGDSPVQALDKLDGALGVMARENRFERRVLAQGFNEFMAAAAAKQVRSRIMPSLSGVHYVFLAPPRETEREARRQELTFRCFVARGLSGAETVVGIATERYEKNAGFSMDVVRLTKPEWSADDQRAVEGIQRDLDYFVTPRLSRARADEFPSVGVPKVGRNERCPCGSGRKYKVCHGRSR